MAVRLGQRLAGSPAGAAHRRRRRLGQRWWWRRRARAAGQNDKQDQVAHAPASLAAARRDARNIRYRQIAVFTSTGLPSRGHASCVVSNAFFRHSAAFGRIATGERFTVT
jgi:hypothetical protein